MSGTIKLHEPLKLKLAAMTPKIPVQRAVEAVAMAFGVIYSAFLWV
jgi:hypothetical protein